MKIKQFTTGIAAVLSTCMIANTVPMYSIPYNVLAAEQTVDFTDESKRGNWNVTSGKGTIAFTDGMNEAGFMTVKSDDNTIFADTATEKRADGFVEMDMKMTKAPNGGRMGIIFRYNSPTDWEGIGIDCGSWKWFNGAGQYGDVSASKNTFTNIGEKHKIRIEYRGKNIKVFVDNEKIIDQNIDNFGKAAKGNVGLRLWGALQGTFDGRCQFDVDNVKTGDLAAEAAVTPEMITIPYKMAGQKECVFTIKENSPKLTKIKNGQTELVSGTDYKRDGENVILSKDYIASVKEKPDTALTFVFEDGQEKVCHILIEKEEEIFSYTRDFSEGAEGFEKVSGNGTMVQNEDSITIQGNGIFVDQKSKDLKNQEVEFTYDPVNNNCNYGVILRYSSPSDYLYVGPSGQNAQHYTNWGVYGPNGKIQDIQDSGFILEGRTKPYKVKVRVVDHVVTIYVDNEEIWNGQLNVTLKPGKTGFCTTANTGMTIQRFTQETAVKYETAAEVTTEEIHSDEMTVKMDSAFPRVEEYKLSTGELVKGQEIPLHQIEINNKIYTPEVKADISGNTANYHVAVDEIGVSFDVVFKVEGHILSMNVENVKERDTLLYTLNFPRHSLVSMSDVEPNAELRVNNYQRETRTALASAAASEAYGETTLAVLSNDNVAASVSGQSYKNRHEMAYQTFACGDHTSTGIWVNEYTYRGLDGEKMYNPWAKVSITTDCNSDNKVDYQDAAIALRDDCMERKTGADLVTDSWNMIAMNVGSEAQSPFLRILDNAKKMSLATDNFQQNVIIKGYQSEGHDASHPDFANYNKRAGGLADFKTLLENSEEYNTKVGIHVNHTDVYPEAPQYDKLKTGLGAWSWYDSALQIVRENDDLDQSENGLDGRFTQLFDKDTKNLLDTVYVDVFFGTRWPMYKLVENINGKNREMALGTEYVDEMVSHSVFAHHIGSQFGGAGNLVRIVDHNQADIFANHQLFRGGSSRANEDIGINGWQGAKNMNLAIQSFYEKILPNKFLAQYPIMQYSSDNKAVLGENNEVVTEMKNGVNVISLDGREVAKGNQMFIPWDNGNEKEGKIYHWNPSGGKTTWTLPKSWENVKTVKIYKLSDKGKEEIDSSKLTQNGNQVTIDAEAKTGYVLYKNEIAEKDVVTADTVDWSAGSPVKDMGFDSHNFDEWKPASTAKTTEHITMENNNLGNSHLYIKGKNDGKVTQTITGLVPGQTYAASVWCITDDGRKASIEVQNGDETVSAYMNHSNVTYGVHHNDKYQTKAQRMQVRFTAKSEKAVLTLAAEKGDSADSVVDFDDVRVMKVEKDTNPDPEKNTYWEDFENTDQGWGAFISTESDQSHLSQKNPVNPKATQDVIDGTYSLKVRAGDYMRTLPSTIRLEPETEYTVGISYKAPSANAFTFAVKSDKANEAGDTENAVIASVDAQDQEGALELKFTTGNYDDYYVDITKKAATEYYVDNFYVQAARPINRETLGQLVGEAETLNKDLYTPESYAKMQDTIEDAKAVLKNEQASQEEIRTVYMALEKVMEELVSYASAEEKATLLEVIATMKSLQESDYKQDTQWIRLQGLIDEAEKLYAYDKTTSPEVANIIRELNAAKNALNPVVDRTALKAIMAKAENVDRNAIVDGVELQTFLSAIENAKAADLKPGVTEKEIAEVTENLMTAYNAIVLKEEAKNRLVSEALKKANEKENYFLEEDWAALTEAKAELIVMKSQSEVKAADYYRVLEKLEGALNNKLNRPAVPSSVEIDSGTFEVSANTEHGGTGGEGPVRFAFDKNPDTIWHSHYNGGVSAGNPAQVTINMKQIYNINQFSYLQRSSGGQNGKVQKYNLYVKENAGDEWKKIVSDGTFEDKAGVQKVKFDSVKAQYVMFEVTQGAGGFAAAAELSVYQKASDFSALQQVMNDIDKLNEKEYTKESFQALKQLYAEAEKLLENPLTEQKAIDKMAESLRKGVELLVHLADSMDIQILENTVSKAEQIELKDYKDTKVFERALREAKKVLVRLERGEQVTQEEVEIAEKALVDAMAKLVPVEKPVVDKSELQAEIDNAILDGESVNYPEVQWEAYQKALAYARKILEKEDASQEDVEDALKMLKDARNALEEHKIDNPKEPTEPSKPSKPDPVQKPNAKPADDANKPVKTGDRNNPLPFSATIAALGLLAVLRFKKRQ